MGMLGKDLFDVDRPRTHTMVRFGEQEYWIEDRRKGIPYGEILTELLDAETYLTAEQCIELGLADRFSADDSKDDTGSTAKEQAAQQTAEQMAAAEMEKRKAKALAAINRYFG
jgi:hypothetical protein